MTNFFGSVMKTIHTDSAYRAISSKGRNGAKFDVSSDQRITTSSDPEKLVYHPETKVRVFDSSYE